jgi:hypothetical protein
LKFESLNNSNNIQHYINLLNQQTKMAESKTGNMKSAQLADMEVGERAYVTKDEFIRRIANNKVTFRLATVDDDAFCRPTPEMNKFFTYCAKYTECKKMSKAIGESTYLVVIMLDVLKYGRPIDTGTCFSGICGRKTCERCRGSDSKTGYHISCRYPLHAAISSRFLHELEFVGKFKLIAQEFSFPAEAPIDKIAIAEIKTEDNLVKLTSSIQTCDTQPLGGIKVGECMNATKEEFIRRIADNKLIFEMVTPHGDPFCRSPDTLNLFTYCTLYTESSGTVKSTYLAVIALDVFKYSSSVSIRTCYDGRCGYENCRKCQDGDPNRLGRIRRRYPLYQMIASIHLHTFEFMGKFKLIAQEPNIPVIEVQPVTDKIAVVENTVAEKPTEIDTEDKRVKRIVLNADKQPLVHIMGAYSCVTKEQFIRQIADNKVTFRLATTDDDAFCRPAADTLDVCNCFTYCAKYTECKKTVEYTYLAIIEMDVFKYSHYCAFSCRTGGCNHRNCSKCQSVDPDTVGELRRKYPLYKEFDSSYLHHLEFAGRFKLIAQESKISIARMQPFMEEIVAANKRADEAKATYLASKQKFVKMIYPTVTDAEIPAKYDALVEKYEKLALAVIQAAAEKKRHEDEQLELQRVINEKFATHTKMGNEMIQHRDYVSKLARELDQERRKYGTLYAEFMKHNADINILQDEKHAKSLKYNQVEEQKKEKKDQVTCVSVKDPVTSVSVEDPVTSVSVKEPVIPNGVGIIPIDFHKENLIGVTSVSVAPVEVKQDEPAKLVKSDITIKPACAADAAIEIGAAIDNYRGELNASHRAELESIVTSDESTTEAW